VTAANDGLIGVVGVQVKATAAENFREDVAWGGDSPGRPAPPIPIAKVCFITPSLTECRPVHEALALGRAQIHVCIPVRGLLVPRVQLRSG